MKKPTSICEYDYTSENTCWQLWELTNEYLHWLVYRVCGDDEADKILKYEHFLSHAQNKSTGGNAIKDMFGSSDNTDAKKMAIQKANWSKLKSLLGNFDPKYVRKTFPENKDALRKEIVRIYGRSEFTKPVEEYIITIFEIGHFLARAQFPDGKAVYDFFNNGYQTDRSKLIQDLRQEQGIQNKALFGLGEGLMPDALKELGYENYVKPDVHVIDIAERLGLSDKTSNGQIAKDVEEIALRIRPCVTPYQLDKFFYLIGSGKFYKTGHETVRKKYEGGGSTLRKQGLEDYVKERLGFPSPKADDRVALLVNDYRKDGLVRGRVGRIQGKSHGFFLTVAFSNEQGKAIEKKLYPTEFVVLRGKV